MRRVCRAAVSAAGFGGWRLRREFCSYRLQTDSQDPAARNLVLGASMELGAWDLELPALHAGPCPLQTDPRDRVAQELFRLPQLIFGGGAVSNWHEGALESLVIIAVWVFVFVATRRILKRFYYLEDQLQMCGWCRKLKGQGDWV